MADYGLDATWNTASPVIINILAEMQKYLAIVRAWVYRPELGETHKKWAGSFMPVLRFQRSSHHLKTTATEISIAREQKDLLVKPRLTLEQLKVSKVPCMEAEYITLLTCRNIFSCQWGGIWISAE